MTLLFANPLILKFVDRQNHRKRNLANLVNSKPSKAKYDKVPTQYKMDPVYHTMTFRDLWSQKELCD